MKERILIIEDDEAIVRVLRRSLAYEGYTVDAAFDGETGLALARDAHPDLVILDWMLPGMDGLEVCQRLRGGGNVPILMLTAKDTVWTLAPSITWLNHSSWRSCWREYAPYCGAPSPSACRY